MKPWMKPGNRRSVTGVPACLERVCVGLALVSERVERGGDDERRREAGQVLGEQRRHPRIGCVSPRGPEVVVRVPVHLGVGEQEALAEQFSRAVAGRHVGRGIDQQLERRRGSAGARRKLRGHRRQIAAGAVAAHGDPVRISTEPAGVRERPAERGVGVVDRGGKPMLGRQPVVDRKYVCAGVAAENSARAVVRVQVAVEEPATVVEDEQRMGTAGLGRGVVAGAERHRRIAPVDLEIAH